MDVWGCTSKSLMSVPTMVDEENGIVSKYWSCPIRFVPGSVWEFIKMYKFYESHPSAPFPSYSEVNPRYLQAETILHSELSKLRELK